jgi:hypothetical protein
MKKYYLIIINVLIIVLIGFKLLNSNQNNNIPVIKSEKTQKDFDNSFFKDETDFPFRKYIESGDFYNYRFISYDLLDLSKKINNVSKAQRIFSHMLTDTLYKYKQNEFTSNLDSLIVTFQWADKFRVYSELDTANTILFASIKSFWIQRISTKLLELSNNNPGIATSFKFRFLIAKCDEIRFNTPVKVNPLDKVIEYILEYKWSHLFQASWNQAKAYQKVLFFLILFTTIISYGLLGKKVYYQLKK